VEATNDKQGSKEGSEIIDGAIATFDDLISKVNKRDVDNKKEHLKNVRKELEEKARALVDKLNKMP
jgi:DNA-binding transcriptional regulator GbsR (MarR family)